MKKIKILMVGLGGIGQRHLRNIYSVLGDKAEVSAFRVRKEGTVLTDKLGVEEGKTLEEKYNFHSFDDYDKALSSKPDAVFICNPTSMHIPFALKAALTGCHLFIEKPVSHNFEGMDELEKIVKEKNLVALTGFQLRFHPCFLKLKKMIKEEVAGNILSVHMEIGEYLPAWHKWEDYRRMYASRRDQGGGVVLSQIHEIDYSMDLFGMPSGVYALGGHFSSLDIDVEDTADILMSFSYKNRLLPVSLHMDYLQKNPSRYCRVIGEKGTITMDLAGLKVVFKDNEGNEQVSDFTDLQRNQLFIDELKHFLNCIDGKEKPRVDLRSAYNGMKIVLAIKESMTSGQKIKLSS